MRTTAQPARNRTKDQRSRAPSLELPRSLRYFLFASLGLTIVSLGGSLVARWLGFSLPYSFSYLFVPRSFFSDFTEFAGHFQYFGKPAFLTYNQYFMYPPAMALSYGAFYAAPHPFWIFGAFLVVSGVFLTICFFRILRSRGLRLLPAMVLALGIAITSYPYFQLLQRWNMEVFVWLAVTIGIWSFYRGRLAWAAVCFGLATALKLYPFIFFALFLPRRRYLEIVLGAFTSVAVTTVALRALSPDIVHAFTWNLQQLQAFGKYYAASTWALGYDHSFFGLVKFVTLPWHPDLTPLLRPYTWFVAIICTVLYFARIWRLPLANQILVLSVISVSIPPVSYDYSLLSLYGSLAILCVIALRIPDGEQRVLIPYFMLYAVILTPESYIILHGIPFGAELRAFCLLGMLILALTTPLPVESAPS